MSRAGEQGIRLILYKRIGTTGQGNGRGVMVLQVSNDRQPVMEVVGLLKIYILAKKKYSKRLNYSVDYPP